MLLQPYSGLHVNYAARKKPSGYYPCSLMMDYVLHHINYLLSDNLCFRRACPNYHPYILRLYYGILFWYQCLRASDDVGALNLEQGIFLSHFSSAFPPESLPISGPLLLLFKTLCSSTPEIPTYGKVYPIVPAAPGPQSKSSFIRVDKHCFTMPNIPGIFALLEDLNANINGADPVYPSRGKHIPVPADRSYSVLFGHHFFPAEMTNHQRWSLASSGLQYPCEAGRELHESFADRYDDFDFPVTAANDNSETLDAFLSMNNSMAWFAQVRHLAAMEASFFEDSGTLADCSTTGLIANQIVVNYVTSGAPPSPPIRSCDPAALFTFSFKLCTNQCSVFPCSSLAFRNRCTN